MINRDGDDLAVGRYTIIGIESNIISSGLSEVGGPVKNTCAVTIIGKDGSNG